MNEKFLTVKIVKDDAGWGVEFDGALINNTPMSYEDAKKLVAQCLDPDGPYTDENSWAENLLP